MQQETGCACGIDSSRCPCGDIIWFSPNLHLKHMCLVMSAMPRRKPEVGYHSEIRMWVTAHTTELQYSASFLHSENCREAHGQVWHKAERASWIKETTKWHKMPTSPCDWWRYGRTVHLLKLVQMSSGFYGRLEPGHRLTHWQLTNGPPTFIELGEGNESAAQLPLAAILPHKHKHTHSDSHRTPL